MQYLKGERVRLGDRVRLDTGDGGTVVFCIDSNEYSTAYPDHEWAYLGRGAMILTDDGALIHYQDEVASFVRE